MISNFQSAHKYYSYTAFLELMGELVAEGKTSGNDQSASLIFFTKLNLQRFQRWDKTFNLSETVARQITNIMPQIWWVINEAWCGDAAQTLPVMEKMALASNGSIDLRIILRDENIEIMDRYLTGISRSIPKLIATDADSNELFTWGPRPAAAQKMMMDWKVDNHGKKLDEIEKEIHLWYAKDKGQSTQHELFQLLKPFTLIEVK